MVPRFQVISRASRAAMAWPKVSAMTATPVGMVVTSITPGIARAAESSTEAAEPWTVGGRRSTVGIAPSTCRSRVYCAWPVIMSLASIREVGVPTRV